MPQELTLSDTAGSVEEFYNNKTVFITGGTGFLGKVLIEKLLRSCPGISKIYVLMRPKKGQNVQERLEQIIRLPLFDLVRKERPNNLSKVLPIEGEITEPELAISESNRELLYRTVNIVFHSAATVKFDEKLKLAVKTNMLGTQRLIEICKRMSNLDALIHVSTAYCNCDRSEVQEVVYPPPIDPDLIVTLVEGLNEETVDSLTPVLVGNRPNTYTFTKALSECWLKDNKGDLPLVIVRPSIVLSSMEGPMKGWVDNWNGPTGLIAAYAKGILRSMCGDGKKTADLVPVDIVINLMIVSAWRIASSKTKEMAIYNCVTGQRKPLSWNDFIQMCLKYIRVYPLSDINWYPDGAITSFRTINTIKRYCLHWASAYLVDSFLLMTGAKPMLIQTQSKLDKACKSLEHFTTHEWDFRDDNVRALSLVQSEADKKVFSFDVANIDWEIYLENYVLGIRRFVFKEDVSTIPKARKKLVKYYVLHRLFQVITIILILQLLALILL